MPRTFLIRIDFDRLSKNLSRQEGRSIPLDELRAWLRDAHFVQHDDDWWMIEESFLGQLEEDEVQEARVLDETEDPSPAGPGGAALGPST